MERANPILLTIALASSFGSVLYFTKARVARLEKVDEQKFGLGVKKWPYLKDDRPKIVFKNNTKVKLTPVEKGTLAGMADDGSYMGYLPAPPQSFSASRPAPSKTYKYIVRYADGSKKEFLEPAEARVQLTGTGVIIVDRFDYHANSTLPREDITNDRSYRPLKLIRKDSAENILLPVDPGAQFGYLASDGNSILTTKNRYSFYDLNTKRLIQFGAYGRGNMNGSGQMTLSLESTICCGTKDFHWMIDRPKNQGDIRPPILSPGIHPQIVVILKDFETERYHFYEVINSNLVELPLPRGSTYPEAVAISPNKDILLADSTNALYLRWKGNWTNLSETQNIRIKFDLDPLSNRIVFEKGITFLTKRIEGEDWICKLEVLN